MKTFVAKQKELVGRRRRSNDSDFHGTCTRRVHVALPDERLANSLRYACRADLLDRGVHLSQHHILRIHCHILVNYSNAPISISQGKRFPLMYCVNVGVLPFLHSRADQYIRETATASH